ncbi:MAG: hypothetical protein Q4C33_02350 [bacterium]|nr:hypothetical protein [bacterium]
MNLEVNIDKRKKSLKIYYGLLITVVCIIGVSFAWFRLYLSQSDNNSIVTRNCFSTTLTESTSKIELADAFPINDEEGLKQEPFSFTLTNNCEGYVNATITLLSEYRTITDNSYLKDNYIKVNFFEKEIISKESLILSELPLEKIEKEEEGYVLKTIGLKSNETKSFDLRLWLDSKTTIEQGLNKVWKGKIVVSVVASFPTLSDAILMNNEVVNPLTVPGSEVSAHTLDDVATQKMSVSSEYQNYYVTYATGWEANGTKFNLNGATVTSETYANSYSELVGKYLPYSSLSSAGSSTAGTMKSTEGLNNVYYVVSANPDSFIYKTLGSTKNTTEALLASTEDDYGTSYYFRGAVKNNYVEFANKCWRIVRITGKGDVKLVLHNNNLNNSVKPCSSIYNGETVSFGTSSIFNNGNNDNTYMGFMYGEMRASNYADTHANVNKSAVLATLETWYKNNLISYESKLADTVWCNDKQTVDSSKDLGYGANGSAYGVFNRIHTRRTSSLVCSVDNMGGKLSKFTVNDTINGNGNLTYKIGLLTADEIVFAGYVDGFFNTSTYLLENASGSLWWTMSPYVVYNGTAYIMYVIDGYLGNIYTTYSSGVRPSIALNSDVVISGGTGTSEDPYIVQ